MPCHARWIVLLINGLVVLGTTDALLVNLGINSLDELPPISPLRDDGSTGFDAEVIR